ncbi:uncharacterized protein LOC141627609 [Silene latifolia]|uniref:uncharacterized protein LOC141627609 n=1 Tax=Silene latifolia TaxID=37657 RepID=UPI003D779B61
MYNNLFAFSSIGGNTNASTHKGIYVFKLHGQIYHNVPNLLPNDGKPKYLQLYFYDGQHEALNRTGCFPEVRADIVNTLMQITQTNPYARFFRSLRELPVNENTQILLNRDTVLDQRVYNAPTSDEVAVIWTESSSSSESNTPHITVTAKNNESHRIMHYYGCYDPLQYPLLFPSGECGWVQGLKKLDPESGHAEASSSGSASLDATQTVQSLLEDEMNPNVGTRVILPPTFLGGPRDMKKRYLNSMALVQRYGKPDLFVTMTCNASWPEIKAQLAPGEEAHNRPDLVARVFRAKLLDLKKQIVNKCIFGEVAAYVYVVEFQKRGLPHVHFLIILKDGYKLKCPADYDKFVSAEIPTMDNPSLRKTVLQHMMHGPCGNLNPDCACMKHSKTPGKCKYEYPKTFTPGTTTNVAGYPEYRRRNSSETAVIRKHRLDNRWVIPYNPYLLTLFDCHLNVEVCSTMHAVKYLYKYIYKGHDRISFSVTENDGPKAVDEISQFQSGRWVSPCEAAWRIFGFDLFETHPAVMALQVHLPNMQSIRLRPTDNLADVLADDKRSRTPLTEFFKKSSTEGCPKRLYGEFTEHYRWDTGTKSWIERRNKVIVIGKLVFIAPAEGERYFLRLLLLHIRGPTSFEDLKTVNGYKCATFQEAALRHRLFEHDNAAELCMAEACAVQMPVALRRLFSTLLIFAEPKDPSLLWDTHYESLSEDYRYNYPGQPQKVRQLTARSVEQYLEAMGKSLLAFGLDHLDTCTDNELRRTRDIIDALDAPIPDECTRCKALLNTAQKEAFVTIMDHVTTGQPGAFFVDGPGGTGKTFLYNALYAEVRLMGKIVLPTATSGIAASNIPSGRTTHSRFKIPLDCDIFLACDIPKQGSLAALIQATSLIIWDEASMAKRQNAESLDLLLRDLCDADHLFGGKVVVFGGDFRQTLPILPRKSQREVVEASLVSSPLWPKLVKFRLTENIRAHTDPEFAEFLLSLGNRALQTKESEYIKMPDGLVSDLVDGAIPPIGDLSSIAFPEMGHDTFNSDIFTSRAIITPLNDDVDAINNELITKFPGNPVSYKSHDSMLDDNCTVYPAEFINKLSPGGMSPHDLILKENCPAITKESMYSFHESSCATPSITTLSNSKGISSL